MPEIDQTDTVEGLLKRAAQGDKSCLPQLRSMLTSDSNSVAGRGLVDSLGSPAERLRRAMIDRLAGKNLAVREAAEMKLAELERELEGPHPTALERLLARRAALCWFQVHAAELVLERATDMTIRQAEWQQRKVDSAHRRFLSSLRTLAHVRKMALPTLLLNVNAASVGTARETVSIRGAELTASIANAPRDSSPIRVGEGSDPR